MKKKATPEPARVLDKLLFEAGLQCPKRLYLDCHRPATGEPSDDRQAQAEAGRRLIELARSAFPKGVAVDIEDGDKAAEQTRKLLEAETPILFGATFRADDVEVRVDILLRQKTGELDLFEVKSGTKVKPRYMTDLALQLHVAERAGHKVRFLHLLHVNPRYAHKAGADLVPQQLFKSADVTGKVRRQLPRIEPLLRQFRAQMQDDSSLQLPMGTFCRLPFPCPHLEACSKEAPKLALHELPELSPKQEAALHEEGIESLDQLDPTRPGLTFKQRRVLQCMQQGSPIIEPFVREELRQVNYPLHFLAFAGVIDTLPRFDGQRPWRLVPYAWAANTLYEDGRLETAAFVHADKEDPRPGFVQSLAKHLEVGGMILCWGDRALDGMHDLLEDLPGHKASIRAVIGRPNLDMMKLFDAGVFHPELRGRSDLRSAASILIGDHGADDLPLHDDEQVRGALQKAWAPRVRATTREKIAAEIQGWVAWQSAALLALWRRFAEVDTQPKPKPAAAPARSAPPKPLPKV